jgi:O-antigen/teichoic acid export membrane protein
MMPILTQLYTLEKTKELHTTIRSATKWIFYINLPIFISLILFGKEILLLFFGSYYEAAYPALLTLSIGYVIYQFLYPVYETLKVFKKTKFILLNTLLTAIINIILNYFLIPQYGIVGGAIATSFSLM